MHLFLLYSCKSVIYFEKKKNSWMDLKKKKTINYQPFQSFSPFPLLFPPLFPSNTFLFFFFFVFFLFSFLHFLFSFLFLPQKPGYYKYHHIFVSTTKQKQHKKKKEKKKSWGGVGEERDEFFVLLKKNQNQKALTA